MNVQDVGRRNNVTSPLVRLPVARPMMHVHERYHKYRIGQDEPSQRQHSCSSVRPRRPYHSRRSSEGHLGHGYTTV